MHYQVCSLARKVDIVMARTDGGISLLHFSCSRLRRALPVILALRSPDFPHKEPFGALARLSGQVTDVMIPHFSAVVKW